MKKTLVLCFLGLLLSLVLIGCNGSVDDNNPYSGIESATRIVNSLKPLTFSDDVAIAFSSHRISIIDYKGRGDFLVPMCSDPLCSHKYEECPLHYDSVKYIAASLTETEENGGYPIIYFSSLLAAEMVYSKGERVMEYLVRYDAATNISEIIYQFDTSNAQVRALSTWYKYCFFSINYVDEEGEQRFKICRYDSETDEVRELDINTYVSRFWDVHDGYLYYSGGPENIYKVDVDLTETTLVRKGDGGGIPAFFGGFIYYFDSSSRTQIGVKGNSAVYSADLMRYREGMEESSELVYRGALENGWMEQDSDGRVYFRTAPDEYDPKRECTIIACFDPTDALAEECVRIEAFELFNILYAGDGFIAIDGVFTEDDGAQECKTLVYDLDKKTYRAFRFIL